MQTKVISARYLKAREVAATAAIMTYALAKVACSMVIIALSTNDAVRHFFWSFF